MSFVEGSYNTPEEAVEAVRRLEIKGYTKDDIRLVSNSASRNAFLDHSNVDVEIDSNQGSEHGHDDDRSFWDKIKDAFTLDDDYDTSNDNDDLLSPYRDDISAGHIVVIVEGEPNDVPFAKEETSGLSGLGNKDLDNNIQNDDFRNNELGNDDFRNNDLVNDNLGDDDFRNKKLDNDDLGNENFRDDDLANEDLTHTKDEQKIKLSEEKLDVDTEEVQTGEVNVSKRVTEETETIEVPVKHEEVVVKRTKVNDGTLSDGELEEEEIVIPVSEEQVNVTKRPEVTEEVTVGKESVEETKHVTEKVKKEELDVDSDGDVVVDDENKLDDHNTDKKW